MRILAAAFLLILSSLGAARETKADLKLHALFSDGMVLQSDFACPVWGTTEPGEEVSVSIAGQKKTAKVGDLPGSGKNHGLLVYGTKKSAWQKDDSLPPELDALVKFLLTIPPTLRVDQRRR